MSKVRTVVATIVAMLCASVSYAQQPFSQSSNPGSYVGFAQTPGAFSNSFSSIDQSIPQSPALGRMYVACWAEASSQNTAYFSATFAARGVGAVHSMRTQFRSFVTTQYGPVSQVQCTGKDSEAVVNEQVEKWKDSARTEKNAIIDLLGDKDAGAPQPQSPQAANIKQDDVTCRYIDSEGGRIKQRVCGTPVEMQPFPHWGDVPYPYDVVASHSNMQR
jgi:hypothetical protein